jgi:hypothetical protein
MRHTSATRHARRNGHTSQVRPGLSPYVVDEITFTRDEIMRARS